MEVIHRVCLRAKEFITEGKLIRQNRGIIPESWNGEAWSHYNIYSVLSS